MQVLGEDPPPSPTGRPADARALGTFPEHFPSGPWLGPLSLPDNSHPDAVYSHFLDGIMGPETSGALSLLGVGWQPGRPQPTFLLLAVSSVLPRSMS